MKKTAVLLACFLMSCLAALAQEEKLEVKSSGRVLLDAAAINSSNDEIHEKAKGGLQAPDVRIGMKLSYGNWEGRAELGYARQSVSLKDVYLQYNFDGDNFVRGGYFDHHFGYQSPVSSSFRTAMEAPETHSALGSDSRLLGVMFEHSADRFFGTFSIYTDNQSMKSSTDKTGNQGKGVMSRLVYRPLTERGSIFQVGMGGSYDHESGNGENLEWSADFPSRVSLVSAIGAKIEDADYALKFSPEVAMAMGRFGLEAQYIFMTVHRKTENANNYKAWGAYGNLRFLLNSEYSYDRGDAVIATPDPKSWEIVAAYNYTDMNSEGYRGGKLSDWSLTMNYYINKYMVWRVSGHYVHTGASDYTGFGKNDYKVIETRMQFKF